jgi:hypothetical protein
LLWRLLSGFFGSTWLCSTLSQLQSLALGKQPSHAPRHQGEQNAEGNVIWNGHRILRR